jgi:hypothetical protein
LGLLCGSHEERLTNIQGDITLRARCDDGKWIQRATFQEACFKYDMVAGCGVLNNWTNPAWDLSVAEGRRVIRKGKVFDL